MADKVTETLVEALKQALAAPGEQRLYRSGKLAGLFAGRSGANAEAAGRALAEGLLEIARTETKGKTVVEWVRLTPRGVDFLHAHESPVRVLEELRDILQMTREGVPVWVLQMQQELRGAGARLAEQVQQLSQRLDALSRRVDETLRRADLHRLTGTNGAEAAIPWAADALAYLDKRRDSGRAGRCALPELFAALRPGFAELSIPDFLEGLRRLHDRRALQLLPFDGPPDALPEPEYALPDGGAVMFYVSR
jgi:hypothetical protein